MIRKKGFYIVQHEARTSREIGEWYHVGDGSLGGYWLMPDSRQHFADAAFSFISDHPVELYPPKETNYHNWQTKELSKYAFPGKMMGMIGDTEQLIPIQGMTKREYFAAKALQALLTSSLDRYAPANRSLLLCADAVDYADTILKHLENNPPSL